MADLLSWIGGTFLQWAACLSASAPFLALAGRGKLKIWPRLLGLAAFFGGCLLLVRLKTIWIFLRSPWQAMLLEATFALGVIILTQSGTACGLTLKITRQAWRDAAIVILLLILYKLVRYNILRIIGLSQRSETPGLEFLLYLVTFPGIAEELAYRGVIQSRLNNLFSQPWSIMGTPIG